MKKIFNIFLWTLILGVFFRLYAEDLHIKQSESGDSSGSIEYNLNIYPKEATPNKYTNSKAYSILTYIFGTVEDPSTTSPNGIVCYGSSCSTLVGKLMSYFNIGVMTIGMLYLSYVISMSSLVEGQGGDAISQKYASYVIPFRSALGAAFLIPTSTGYTVLQAAILKIILLGSNAGTFMWHFLETYHSSTGSPIGSENISESNTNTLGTTSLSQSMIQDFSKVFVCIEYLNTPQGRTTVESELSNDVQSTNFFSWRLENEKLTTGIDGDSGSYSYQNCPCGSIDFTNLTNYQDLIISYATNVRGIVNAYISDFQGDFEDNLGEDVYESYEEQLYQMSQYLKNDLDLSLLNEAQSSTSTSNVDINSEWLDIPQYFFSLLSPSSNTTLSITLTEYMNLTYPSTTLSQTVQDLSKDIIDFTTYNQSSSSTQGLTLNFSKDSSPAIDDLNNQLNEIFDAGDSDDALLKFANFGKNWLKIAMGLLTAALVLSVLMNFITGIASDFIPASILGMGIAFFSFLIAGFQVITVIIPIATMFAISMPMTPLITFTSAILTWVSQSVIAVFAAPLLAIGLISPGDGLGRAASSLFLVINIFLRPMLNVIGLVAGAKLFNIAYYYLTNVYFAAVQDVFTIIGDDKSIIAAIASIMFLYIYAFMMVSACTRCYGLVYLLPDKVLTWVSGPAIPSNETSQTISAAGSLISRASQKGMQMNQKFMEGVGAMAAERNQLFMEKAKEIEKGAFPKDQLFAQKMYDSFKSGASSAKSNMSWLAETVGSSVSSGITSIGGAASSVAGKAFNALASTKAGSAFILAAANLYQNATITATNIKNFPSNVMNWAADGLINRLSQTEKGRQVIFDSSYQLDLMNKGYGQAKRYVSENFINPTRNAISQLSVDAGTIRTGLGRMIEGTGPLMRETKTAAFNVLKDTYNQMGQQFSLANKEIFKPIQSVVTDVGSGIFKSFSGTKLGSSLLSSTSSLYESASIAIQNGRLFPSNVMQAASQFSQRLMSFDFVRQGVLATAYAPKNIEKLSNEVGVIKKGLTEFNYTDSFNSVMKSTYKMMSSSIGGIATQIAPELKALRSLKNDLAAAAFKSFTSNSLGSRVVLGGVAAYTFNQYVSNSLGGWASSLTGAIAGTKIGSAAILGASQAIGDDSAVKKLEGTILGKISEILSNRNKYTPEELAAIERLKPWIGNKEYADKLEPWLTEEGLITQEKAIERQAEGRERDLREDTKENLKSIANWLNSLISKKNN